MRLMVGIPAFNEARTVETTIAQIPRAFDGVDEIIVLVVDDGSTDGTDGRAEASGALVVRHGENRGVGAAFQTIVHYALETAVDILVTIDADGQFQPSDIPHLVSPLQCGHADFCTASRFMERSLVPEMPWIKKWGNRCVSRLVTGLTGHRFRDVSCGFRAYTRHALLRLSVHGNFTYTHETILDLAGKRIAMCEVPLSVRGTREFGQSRVASSILRYAVQTSWIILRFQRDHFPFRLCGWFGLPLLLCGAGLFATSYWRWMTTGSWLKWAAFSGGAFLGLAISVAFVGFLADIAGTLRRQNDELLYWIRKSATRDGTVADVSTQAASVVEASPIYRMPARGNNSAA